MWKLIAAVLGYLWMGPLGILLGLVVGHFVDSGKSSIANLNIKRGSVRQQQAAFFQTLFLLMGRVAKADGVVSTEEIKLASDVMDRMGLVGEAKKQAIELFNQGKEASFDLVDVLSSFQQVVGEKSVLTRTLIEILLVSAYADGDFSLQEKSLVSQVCAHLGISVAEFEQLHLQIKQQAQFRQNGGAANHLNDKEMLQAAYDAIGVEASMSDAEIKKAYRKLMSQNHPDKMTAKGLPDEMILIAKERTQEIQAAYDLIKKTRKSVS
ncbi:Dna-J like membrane chaperone protein [Marinomonas sp. MED121]|uniref:co-chaperone DjlA n=1 Tax=Marinomonas sp. MED121 TaxID=314277 RepID=UPI00006902E1|nr:co-chaperone DjlA [Marinomonas sp. MED121]EAQ66508.1 Dna-J like membrane chaperone protein [Marinomonas sp. MED121]